MTIIVIEDEIKTAKALGQLILSIRPDAQILSYIQSIDGAVSYLLENDQPDLIFMDIQLIDGLSFQIFQQVVIRKPVIFITAFNASISVLVMFILIFYLYTKIGWQNYIISATQQIFISLNLNRLFSSPLPIGTK